MAMTYDEFVTQLVEKFEARPVPYWKLKDPPKYSELLEFFKRHNPMDPDGRAEKARMEELAATERLDLQRKKYWENRTGSAAKTTKLKGGAANAQANLELF